MTPIRSARRFGIVTALLLLILTVLWFSSSWAIDVWVSDLRWRTLLNVFTLLICAFLLFGIAYWRFRAFKCPSCKSHLGKQQTSPLKTDILFYCEKCDIVWDAGVRKNPAV